MLTAHMEQITAGDCGRERTKWLAGIKMYPNLKLQIFRRGSHQNQLAKAVGIDETVLSKIIHGCRIPTVAQRRILSAYLEVDEAWLFERYEISPQRGLLGSMSVGDKVGTDGDA